MRSGHCTALALCLTLFYVRRKTISTSSIADRHELKGKQNHVSKSFELSIEVLAQAHDSIDTDQCLSIINQSRYINYHYDRLKINLFHNCFESRTHTHSPKCVPFILFSNLESLEINEISASIVLLGCIRREKVKIKENKKSIRCRVWTWTVIVTSSRV